MPNLVAISQATAKIRRGAESAPPPGIECFKSPRSDRVKICDLIFSRNPELDSKILVNFLSSKIER